MDDSMNSVHSISAMDISPATSPRFPLNPITSNNYLINTFQQQQELLANILFNQPNINDYSIIKSTHIQDDFDINSKSMCLYSTVLTENNDENKSPPIIPEEINQIRQRIIPESIPTIIEPTLIIKKSSRSFNKILLFIPIVLFIIYFQYTNKSITVPRSSNWQNASEYLTKNLIGQDQGLNEFNDAMEKHKNFSIVLIEGSIGTGKSHLASSLEKFLPTTLISANTLLGLTPHHRTDSHRLSQYFLSNLSPSLFQYFILDDLDLISNNELYCQTLSTALHSLKQNNNHNKNLFILLLQTNKMSNLCRQHIENILTKSIQFNMLQRHHIQICIQNEAYVQNVQPTFNNQEIEEILNSLEYINKQGILYGETGCKQIPSRVMLASRKKSL